VRSARTIETLFHAPWLTRASADERSIVLFYDPARQPQAQTRAIPLSREVGLEHIVINRWFDARSIIGDRDVNLVLGDSHPHA
jgi:hypothetical protein